MTGTLVLHCDVLMFYLASHSMFSLTVSPVLHSETPNPVLCQAGRCSERSAPKGQLAGRAGRKCLLEDGERYLSRAMDASGEEKLEMNCRERERISLCLGRPDAV